MKRSTVLTLALLSLLLAPSLSFFRARSVKAAPQQAAALPNPPEFACGYAPFGAEEEASNHRLHLLRAAKSRGEISTQGLAPVRITGNLAVVEDNGAIVMQPNDFDLKNRSVVFTPDGDGYTVNAGDLTFTKDFGQPLSDFSGADGRPTANANNGYREVDLGGAHFTFFGTNYDRLFVGINGYVTFTQGDTASRTSAAALANEMPRIAPLWADLDVSQEGGVYYRRLEGRHLFTWAGAPQVQYSGYSTFQLALFDDGRIAFVYKKVKARNALIGISRGQVSEDPQPLDFSAARGEHVGAAAFESFSRQKRIDIPALTEAFYAAQPDEFDTVYVWTDFAFDNGIGYATAFIVRNDIQGIGVRQFDRGAIYGSPSRLSSVVISGDIVRSWPDDPNAVWAGIFSPVAIATHELGHRWLSYVRFATRRDAGRDDLLGRDLNHWSFLMDSRSTADGAFTSVMEGNAWSGGSSGVFRTIESSANYFNELDQYLMGLRPASEVGDIDYVEVNETQHDALRLLSPSPNFTVPGARQTVSVDQIIAQEGERLPGVETSPKEFRVAFLLLTERGSAAAASTLDRLDRYRLALGKYFSQATSRRATLDTSLSSQ